MKRVFSVTGAKRVGVNPKVNNMLQGYDAATHELILISDCGLRSEYNVQCIDINRWRIWIG